MSCVSLDSLKSQNNTKLKRNDQIQGVKQMNQLSTSRNNTKQKMSAQQDQIRNPCTVSKHVKRKSEDLKAKVSMNCIPSDYIIQMDSDFLFDNFDKIFKIQMEPNQIEKRQEFSPLLRRDLSLNFEEARTTQSKFNQKNFKPPTPTNLTFRTPNSSKQFEFKSPSGSSKIVISPGISNKIIRSSGSKKNENIDSKISEFMIKKKNHNCQEWKYLINEDTNVVVKKEAQQQQFQQLITDQQIQNQINNCNKQQIIIAKNNILQKIINHNDNNELRINIDKQQEFIPNKNKLNRKNESFMNNCNNNNTINESILNVKQINFNDIKQKELNQTKQQAINNQYVDSKYQKDMEQIQQEHHSNLMEDQSYIKVLNQSLVEQTSRLIKDRREWYKENCRLMEQKSQLLEESRINDSRVNLQLDESKNETNLTYGFYENKQLKRNNYEFDMSFVNQSYVDRQKSLNVDVKNEKKINALKDSILLKKGIGIQKENKLNYENQQSKSRLEQIKQRLIDQAQIQSEFTQNNQLINQEKSVIIKRRVLSQESRVHKQSSQSRLSRQNSFDKLIVGSKQSSTKKADQKNSSKQKKNIDSAQIDKKIEPKQISVTIQYENKQYQIKQDFLKKNLMNIGVKKSKLHLKTEIEKQPSQIYLKEKSQNPYQKKTKYNNLLIDKMNGNDKKSIENVQQNDQEKKVNKDLSYDKKCDLPQQHYQQIQNQNFCIQKNNQQVQIDTSYDHENKYQINDKSQLYDNINSSKILGRPPRNDSIKNCNKCEKYHQCLNCRLKDLVQLQKMKEQPQEKKNAPQALLNDYFKVQTTRHQPSQFNFNISKNNLPLSTTSRDINTQIFSPNQSFTQREIQLKQQQKNLHNVKEKQKYIQNFYSRIVNNISSDSLLNKTQTLNSFRK